VFNENEINIRKEHVVIILVHSWIKLHSLFVLLLKMFPD